MSAKTIVAALAGCDDPLDYDGCCLCGGYSKWSDIWAGR